MFNTGERGKKYSCHYIKAIYFFVQNRAMSIFLQIKFSDIVILFFYPTYTVLVINDICYFIFLPIINKCCGILYNFLPKIYFYLEFHILVLQANIQGRFQAQAKQTLAQVHKDSEDADSLLAITFVVIALSIFFFFPFLSKRVTMLCLTCMVPYKIYVV